MCIRNIVKTWCHKRGATECCCINVKGNIGFKMNNLRMFKDVRNKNEFFNIVIYSAEIEFISTVSFSIIIYLILIKIDEILAVFSSS